MGKVNETIEKAAYNIIDRGAKVIGDFFSDGNVRIDGSLKGKMEIAGKLVVGSDAEIEGEIHCGCVEIEGKVLVSKLHCDGLVVLKSTSELKGELFCDKLAVEQGASFNGTCRMHSETRENNQ